jgi:hypothetical protein
MFSITAHPRFFDKVELLDVIQEVKGYDLGGVCIPGRVPVILCVDNSSDPVRNPTTFLVGYVRPSEVSRPDITRMIAYQGYSEPLYYTKYDEWYADGTKNCYNYEP